MISLTLPSSAEKDPLANAKTQVLASEGSEVSVDSQRAWVERFVPLLLAKTPVQVILWNQLTDSAAHYFPHGGLFDAEDQAKPALDAMRRVRQQYLM
jgi:hypothetical protein